MAKEYIEREEAIDLFWPVGTENDGSDGCTVICKPGNYTSAEIESMLSELPAVDAVEVVRCKDCKWYKEGKLLSPNKFCFRLKHPREDRKIGYNFSPDDFCSYGERRENNG